MWARRGSEPFHLVKIYPITAASGRPGPKRREGDLQVPEGFYTIDLFNPKSLFHLSLRLNYPNAADRLLSDPDKPGCDIYIHGGAASVGCLPLGDDGIEEVYHRVERSRQPVSVHLFPARMAGKSWEDFSAAYPDLASFWQRLQPAYDAFERDRQLPVIHVLANGRYAVTPSSKSP
jgi:murein L,D-transpeptidase YafK